jgi:hypothetical protein
VRLCWNFLPQAQFTSAFLMLPQLSLLFYYNLLCCIFFYLPFF